MLQWRNIVDVSPLLKKVMRIKISHRIITMIAKNKNASWILRKTLYTNFITTNKKDINLYIFSQNRNSRYTRMLRWPPKKIFLELYYCSKFWCCVFTTPLKFQPLRFNFELARSFWIFHLFCLKIWYAVLSLFAMYFLVFE